MSINKPFKDLLWDLIDEALYQYENTHATDLQELHKSDYNTIA